MVLWISFAPLILTVLVLLFKPSATSLRKE